LKARGLTKKLLTLALLTGVCITAILLGLQYYSFRATALRLAAGSEKTLLASEATRLDTLGARIADRYAAAIESSLAANDRKSIEAAARDILTDNSAAVGVSVFDKKASAVFVTSRQEPWVRELNDAEKRTVHRQLGLNDHLGTLDIVVARPGLVAAAEALRQPLERGESLRFQRSLWVLIGAGIAITVALTVLTWFAARRIQRPIVRLIRTAERIGEGDYTQPHAVTSNNEIAELERALDQMRQKLRQTTITKDYLTTVLNSMSDAVLVTTPDGTIREINNAAVILFGFSEEEVAGKSFATLLVDTERDAFSMSHAMQDVRETVIRTRSGQTIPVSLSGSPITAEDPQFQGAIFVVRNITDRKRAERRIRYLARYDALTKIPNRMQFQHLLQQSIARARKNERGVLLLYLDMDRFKEINDTFGHAAGDRTLEVLSERLTRILPREAVCGRLAGDEFGLYLEGVSYGEEERAQAAHLARMVLSEVCKAFYVQQQEVFLTASVGIAFCPKDAENVIDLIRNADAAMYHSKQNGGNSFAFYSPEMNAAAVERLMLKSKLRRALERDELQMYYQPKIDLRNGRIIGAEALLRWRLPGYGDIPPSQFIPLAEETTLILGIGEWVMNRVCADYREWLQRVPDPGRVSINLSLKQLRQASFITRCKSVFRKHEVSPTCFELEITETTLMADPKRTIKLLDELYAMGLHLSIDDFGTGYSSLSALQQFPIGTLKIDQSFVRDAAVDSDDATIIRMIIDMGKALEVEVVAEGVETEEQLNFLRTRGCHYGQGRLFGDAMSADEFLGLMISQQQSGRSNVSKLFA
jgi:diguanylate cyclase (GGDEF)-like protein/PAS domain S-box-containing protein